MLDRNDRSRVWWLGLALLFGGVLAFVLYAFVGTFVLGLFLYYAARPVYERLRHRMHSPSLTAGVALVVLALPALLLFAYTLALAIGELQSFVNGDIPFYEELLVPYLEAAGTPRDIRTVVETILADPGQLLRESSIRDLATGVATSVTAYLGIALTGVLHLFVALALAFYLLRDGERLVAWVTTQLPDETLVAYGRAVDADLQTIFFGNILNALLTGTIGAIVFSVLAAVAPPEVPVPVPVLLGLLAGAGSLVPVVGMKIVYVPVALLLTVRSVLADPATLWFPVVFVVVTVVVVDTIPDLVLRPYVSGRNLHVGSVMFAYIFGPLLFGWYGLFLGPLLLVVVADFARVVVPELFGTGREPESVSLTGEPIDGTPFAPDGSPQGVVDGDGETAETGGGRTDDGQVPTGGADESEAETVASEDGAVESEAEEGRAAGDGSEASGSGRSRDGTSESGSPPGDDSRGDPADGADDRGPDGSPE